TTTARRSGSRMPWPRRNTPSTIEYMAVVIATPAASDRIANAVNSGVAASRLSASRVSVPIDAERSTAGVGGEIGFSFLGLGARLDGIQAVPGSIPVRSIY